MAEKVNAILRRQLQDSNNILDPWSGGKGAKKCNLIFFYSLKILN
jgi:hypothetical protein